MNLDHSPRQRRPRSSPLTSHSNPFHIPTWLSHETPCSSTATCSLCYPDVQLHPAAVLHRHREAASPARGDEADGTPRLGLLDIVVCHQRRRESDPMHAALRHWRRASARLLHKELVPSVLCVFLCHKHGLDLRSVLRLSTAAESRASTQSRIFPLHRVLHRLERPRRGILQQRCAPGGTDLAQSGAASTLLSGDRCAHCAQQRFKPVWFELE